MASHPKLSIHRRDLAVPIPSPSAATAATYHLIQAETLSETASRVGGWVSDVDCWTCRALQLCGDQLRSERREMYRIVVSWPASRVSAATAAPPSRI